MATTYKSLLNEDSVSNKTLLHESIPLTGTIVSGTYADNNIKNYSHGIFQSVYDYPYLSSSANHVFDVTCGYSSNSSLSKSAGGASGYFSEADQKKKINVYNELAQVLVGYDATGSIQEFDEDGDITAGGTKIQEAYFLNFARLLTKDEIKKGTFTLQFQTGGANNAVAGILSIADTNAQNSYKVNSPAGEYGILKVSAKAGTADTTHTVGDAIGLLYYQAGIAVITASAFTNFGPRDTTVAAWNSLIASQFLSGNALSGNCDALRNRFYNVTYNNTTELNSTIYFCRANHNEFNYSTNPTYLSSSQIVVKENPQDNPISYITTVGLYSSDNELLAVAKLSEPIRKDPTTELNFRVRLDY